MSDNDTVDHKADDKTITSFPQSTSSSTYLSDRRGPLDPVEQISREADLNQCEMFEVTPEGVRELETAPVLSLDHARVQKNARKKREEKTHELFELLVKPWAPSPKSTTLLTLFGVRFRVNTAQVVIGWNVVAMLLTIGTTLTLLKLLRTFGGTI